MKLKIRKVVFDKEIYQISYDNIKRKKTLVVRSEWHSFTVVNKEVFEETIKTNKL